MAEKGLPSSSDESDEDFVPEGQPDVSEDESSDSNAEESGDDDHNDGPKSRKRRKVARGRGRKKETKKTDETEGEVKPEKVTDVDALWADFKEDVNKMEKKIASNQDKEAKEDSSTSNSEKSSESNSNSSGVSNLTTSSTSESNQGAKKIRNIPRPLNTGNRLGLNKILNQIGKKEKMSTLAKSQLDWNKFKKVEGIEEELKTHNKGKDGYLEKQDFLQRTDLRQFEIEKQLRTSRRNF